MTDVWSQRAKAFQESPTHREGPDLDLLVEWCEPGPDVKVLDVATGGGHVARRLRDEGCTVVTVDPAPGMQPDVVAPAERLPFEDGSFDVVTCRIAAHHFQDVGKAVAEMARVAQRLVVIEDNVFVDDRVVERVEDGDALDVLAALARRHAGDDVRPVVAVVERVEGALAAGDAGGAQLGVLVDEDRHR